jgi:hypothetical protein
MFHNGFTDSLSTARNEYSLVRHESGYQLAFINARILKTLENNSAHLFDVRSCGHDNGGTR